MNVAELRTILAHLPDDLPVSIRADDGWPLHVDEVLRRTNSRYLDPGVFLIGRTHWKDPEPPVTVLGPVRDREGMVVELGETRA